MTISSLRWAFRVGAWQPSKEEWTKCCSLIQPEEYARIMQFYYKRDAAASLIGRLMLRKCIEVQCNFQYDQIVLGRTDKGKPYWQNSAKGEFSFNVSHSGDFVVLASEPTALVGVDVMKVSHPGNKSVADFFTTMNRQFTKQEWNFIQSPQEANEQLRNFYRLWTLKESYVKAIGTGIGFSLERLRFEPRQNLKSNNRPISSTKLYVDDELESNVIFQENTLDFEHIVSVAIPVTTDCDYQLAGGFSYVTLPQLYPSQSVKINQNNESYAMYCKMGDKAN